MAIQRDGKIVLAGRSVSGADGIARFALARYTTSGALDPSFGEGGKVVTAFRASRVSVASALAIQRDGMLVVAGWSTVERPLFAVARYTRHGRLDPTFGTLGTVVTAFGGRNPRGAVARALATQPDGKIVAAGEDASRFALARYTVRGKLDPSFGRDGKVLTRFGGSSDVRAVALQPDGKIVVAGAALIHQRDSFALARYTAHGRLDMGFGASGRVVTDVGPWSEANAMALDKGGNLVVAGGVGFKDFGLARYTADGELDPGFGDGGTITTNFLLDCPTCVSDDWAYAVAIQRDGKIVAAGGTDAGGAVGPKGGELDSFALARYSEDGVLDPTFGSGGKLVTRFGGRNSVVQAIAIQADGKLLAAGGGAGYFSLARYTRNGGLDRTFGRGGTVLTSFQ